MNMAHFCFMFFVRMQGDLLIFGSSSTVFAAVLWRKKPESTGHLVSVFHLEFILRYCIEKPKNFD